MENEQKKKEYIDFQIGKYDLFFKKSYEIIYNVNDFLISLWFLLGSIGFLFKDWENLAVWLFIIGSVQFSIRPLIRVIHSFHLKRYVKKQFKDFS
ncbi:YrhK family protein [Radiobacillus sp. PE A8.2]|uniref:YrhK family protein n=1 Tax=Radiobacillus sp. PE A8.2 TaxID=3380349 RepID=UPI00388E73BE